MRESLNILSQSIAQNTFLQMIAILVAVFTAVIFLIRNIPPIAKFAFDVFAKGINKAISNLVRAAIRRAQADYSDIRLIFTSVVLFQIRILMTFLNLAVTAYLSLLIFLSFDRPGRLSILFASNFHIDAQLLIGMLLVLIPSVAITWYALNPILQFIYYLRAVRRYLRRETRKSHQQKGG